jgi:hypothetical protein
MRWATYASKKLEHENAPKGTIHKKDDDAPDSLRYFMTLMPDLKFDNVEKPNRDSTPTYLNASTADFDLDRVVMTDKKYASIYEVHETESNWGFEN